MKDKKIQHAQKRKYEKPRIRAIRLSADEVLATGCKTSPVSIGFGSNPLDRNELPFVYEKALKIAPTAVCVLSGGGPGDILFPNGAPVPPDHRPSSFSYPDMLHGEEKIELHQPLPTSGSFVAVSRSSAHFARYEQYAQCQV